MSSYSEVKDLLSKLSEPEVMKLAQEYARIAALSNRSPQEDDRLGEILEAATSNEVLSFWLTEIDHFLGHHLKLLDDSSRESYHNQQALLREHVGAKDFPVPTDEQIKAYRCRYQSDLYDPDEGAILC